MEHARRARAWLAVLAVSITFLGSGSRVPAAFGDGFSFHIRTTDRHAASLLENGYARSPTFRRLVAAIDDMDLIVYVQPVSWLPPPTEACVQFAGVAGEFRYLRVSFLSAARGDQATALIGHELQHIVEVGGAPEVVDPSSFARFYAAAGHASVNGLETRAAQVVGERIAGELRAAPRPAEPPSRRF